ncbi:MAG: acetylornithine deacetylase [Salinisphaeraceae bacterium]|nr:acetylornithine deacetylase [Salinisphaeraceae bacterium]
MKAIPTLESMIADVVALPSISSGHPQLDMGNRAVAECLANWLSNLGFSCEIQSLDLGPDKVNLIATLGQGEGGLVLAGHLDTVPFDEGAWHSDPFTLQKTDKALVGLGTSDMKSFLCFATEAAAQFANKTLREPLIILGTADEECGMDGAKALVAAGKPRARHAVIGEPTGLKPVISHKGILMERIEVRGQSGHSSNPALGRNAIEGMHRVLSTLLRYRDELAQGPYNPAFNVQHSTLNTGCIHGGDNANRIPALCQLDVDLRFLPGMRFAELRNELQSRVREALHGSELEVEFESLFEGINPFQTDSSADIVKAAEKLTGQPASAVDFATEGSLLNSLGMQTIVLGPGDIDQAHQPNESLALERIEPTRKLLTQLIAQYCL